MLFTLQISKQRVQLEPSEVGCGGKRRARSIGRCVRSTGQVDSTMPYSKEADENGAQDEHDHQEDEECGLGIDMSSHQTHQQTQQGDDCAIKQRPPVARWKDMVGSSGHRGI